MRFNTITAAILSLFSLTSAMDTEVEITSGPIDCPENLKVAKGKHLKISKQGIIHKTSPVGHRGTLFDSTEILKKTFDFEYGGEDSKGVLVPGLEMGMLGLCKDAVAVMVIPPHEGFGDEGSGQTVPAGAILDYYVKIISVSDEAPLFTRLDTDKSGDISKDEMKIHFESLGTGLSQSHWDREDLDGDGVVSWLEFKGPKSSIPPASFLASYKKSKEGNDEL